MYFSKMVDTNKYHPTLLTIHINCGNITIKTYILPPFIFPKSNGMS